MSENDNIIIRLANKNDIDALVEFNCRMAFETENKELKPEILRPGVEGLFQNRQYGFYVIAEDRINGERAGGLMITYEWSDWRNGLIWWIQSVYIMPDYRRRGIYRRLYEFVKDLAQAEKSVCGFRLYVEKENTIAQRTYLSLGMEETHYLMFEEMF
jgi:ribosomal protein S18 acetylase RimI-like enzyme